MDDLAKHRLDRAIAGLVKLLSDDYFKGERKSSRNVTYKYALQALIKLINYKEKHVYYKDILANNLRTMNNVINGSKDKKRVKVFKDTYEAVQDFDFFYNQGKEYRKIFDDTSLTEEVKGFRTEAKKKLTMICETTCTTY